MTSNGMARGRREGWTSECALFVPNIFHSTGAHVSEMWKQSPPYIHDGSFGLESQGVRPDSEQRLGRRKRVVEAGDLASPKVSNIAQTRPNLVLSFFSLCLAQIAGLPG